MPSLLFSLLSTGIFRAYDLQSKAPSKIKVISINVFDWFQNSGTEALINASLLILIAWIGGIILVAINRELIRFAEGYGSFNPFNLLHCLEKRRFDRIDKKVEDLDNEMTECEEKGEVFSLDSKKKLRIKSLLLVERFPSKEFLLPTSFGNIMRAFETYPMSMYGVDAIVAWERLLSVIPKDYRDFIDDAKSHINFWLNLWYLLIVWFFEYWILAFHYGFSLLSWPWHLIIALILFTLFLWFTFSRASSSAQRYGKFVKSAFDLYLPDLQRILGFISPDSDEEARKQWQQFNQAILYARPDLLPQRRYYRQSDEKS